jgi:hypothetical protein
VYSKDKKAKEIEEVKKQARKETLGKSELSKNIHKVLMSKMLAKWK